MNTKKKKLTDCEIDKILPLYTNGMSIRKISRLLHTSDKKVKEVLLKSGISTSDPNCVYLKHKPDGYWFIKENCENVAKKCDNRSDFNKKYPAAYVNSLKNGWLDDFEKYFSKETKFYGFNEKIHLIYAYEMKDQKSVYIGRTINLKRRDNTHRTGTKLNSGEIYYDSVNMFCKINSCEIPSPIILEDKLTATESQKMENEWINTYKRQGWYIVNKARTGENIGSLGSTMRKWTYETCERAAITCKSKSEYRKKYPTASRVSTQNNWLNDFFTNTKKNNGCFDSLDACINESKKYTSMSDIKIKYPFLYHKICKHKWNDIVRLSNGWKKYQQTKK